MRHRLPPLFAIPSLVCAQTSPVAAGSAVHIVLQTDPAPDGTAPPDTGKAVGALQAFVQRESIQALAAGGDGWELGIRLTPIASESKLIAAKVLMRLSRVKAGKLDPTNAKESLGLVMALDVEHWDDAFVDEAWRLLAQDRLVHDRPVISRWDWKELQTHTGLELVDFSDEQGILPVQTADPTEAERALKDAPLASRVPVDLEVVLDPRGRVETVIGRAGREPLLLLYGKLFMPSVYKPRMVGNQPVRAWIPSRIMVSHSTKIQ